MADADKLLKILVELEVLNESDVKAAGELLDQTSKKTEQFGEKAEMSHRSLRMLTNAMGEGVPGAAHLMEAAFVGAAEPMIGATFLLVGGLDMLHKAFEKLEQQEEAARKMGEALNDIDSEHTQTLEKQREAAVASDVAQSAYLHNLSRDTRDAIDKAAELTKTLVQARAAAEASQDTALHGAAGKDIEDMEQRGVVSHATAVRMKEQLDIQYEQQKVARQMALDQLELQNIQTQEAAKEGMTTRLRAAENVAAEKSKEADRAKADNDTRMAEAQGKIDKAQGFKKDLREQGVTEESVQNLRDVFARFTSSAEGQKMFTNKMGGQASQASLSEMFTFVQKELGIGGRTGEYAFGMLPQIIQKSLGESGNTLASLAKLGPQGDKLLAMYEGANLDIKSGNVDLNRGRGRQADLDTSAETAKSDLDAAREKEKKNKEEIQALQDQIATMSATQKTKEGGALADLGISQASTSLTQDRDTIASIQGGGAVSNQQMQQMMDDAAKIAGHAVNVQTAMQILENGANNAGIFMNQLTRLGGILGKIDPAQIDQLRQQIDDLAGRVAAKGQ